jgi:hypothetical protein
MLVIDARLPVTAIILRLEEGPALRGTDSDAAG